MPTIYSRLEGLFDKMSPDEQKRASTAAKAFRLQVSGSAALPVSLSVHLCERSDASANNDGARSAAMSCSSASG